MVSVRPERPPKDPWEKKTYNIFFYLLLSPIVLKDLGYVKTKEKKNKMGKRITGKLNLPLNGVLARPRHM